MMDLWTYREKRLVQKKLSKNLSVISCGSGRFNDGDGYPNRPVIPVIHEIGWGHICLL